MKHVGVRSNAADIASQDQIGSGAFVVSGTAPSSPTPGQRWLDLDDGTEYTWVDDGTSAQWVDLSGGGGGGGGLTLVVVTGTTVTAAANQHLVLTNAAATTATLSASPTAGDTVWVTVANSRFDNVINRNGSNLMGLAENMTVNLRFETVRLRYIDATRGWRLV